MQKNQATDTNEIIDLSSQNSGGNKVKVGYIDAISNKTSVDCSPHSKQSNNDDLAVVSETEPVGPKESPTLSVYMNYKDKKTNIGEFKASSIEAESFVSF